MANLSRQESNRISMKATVCGEQNWYVHIAMPILGMYFPMGHRLQARGIASIRHPWHLKKPRIRNDPGGNCVPDFEAVANMEVCSEPAWTHSRRASKTGTRFAREFFLIFTCLLVSACAGPGYYLQAASGQWQLMHARQDINELIENVETDPALVTRLQTAIDILGFAEKELGLPAGDSYQSYVETGRTAVTWNVVTTPEFSLAARKWCFPVAGCVPYRGYFEKEKAQRFASKQRAKSLDVSVSPAIAYSTLGWFEDPLLDTILQGDSIRLAATLFHELAHRKLYVSGDASFNEAYAGFVELKGVKAWLQSVNDREKEQAWLLQRAARADFHQLLTGTRKELSALYQQKLSETDMRRSKTEIFDKLRLHYAEMKRLKWKNHDYFSAWIAGDINNAQLALFQSYEGGICAFTALYAEAGNDITQFHRLAQERSGMTRNERQSWLAQNCPDVASDVNL